ncbi:MAG: DUF4112 domain-containing protein [Roseomonas sp.]|nr:DUF4112 domain-containing protein [Roseomonas sp.]MCA3431000.1 DUF4112 domain-containing protein [Roseomonas sp.]MCA3434034.1 DUF4112 domain-containing protein [Roseomonas sp.]
MSYQYPSSPYGLAEKPIRCNGQREAALARLERLAWLLDSAISVPGTSFRLGADALANLLPGLGPLVSKGVSAWLILEAWRFGVPRSLLLRMCGNIALDAAIGAVPVLGWAADAFFRANRRNMALLRAAVSAGMQHPARPSPLVRTQPRATRPATA